MINELGPKRTMILLVLVGIMALLAGANYLLLQPNANKTKQQLDSVNAESATLRSEVEKMRADLALIEKQKLFFNDIQRMGFFNDQDRLLARQRFDTMQKLSKIISARYEIRAATIVPDENADKAGYAVMDSPIVVNLTALDDLDVYRFVYYLNYGFPGHITINKMNIERKKELTSDVLKSIGTGSPPEIITARLELKWRTMAKKDSIDAGVLAPGNGMQAGAVQ